MNEEFMSFCWKMTPISLAELDSVALLDRIDRKYVLKREGLQLIINELQKEYKNYKKASQTNITTLITITKTARNDLVRLLQFLRFPIF